jgi:hypothetical protein
VCVCVYVSVCVLRYVGLVLWPESCSVMGRCSGACVCFFFVICMFGCVFRYVRVCIMYAYVCMYACMYVVVYRSGCYGARTWHTYTGI